MGDIETSLATAALAIAISALVIALGQLVSQLFSTADGYRRCQESVIGDWFQLVELPFRWSSFRYEVKFTTPHFEIGHDLRSSPETSFLKDEKKPLPRFPWSIFSRRSSYLVDESTPVALIGTTASRTGTYCQPVTPPWNQLANSEDAVTWASLLQDIHVSQYRIFRSLHPHPIDDRNIKEMYDFLEGPIPDIEGHLPPSSLPELNLIYISRRTRSWDLMPPDIVRPAASTTMGCLITIAHRMGMVWTDINFDEGRCRARGHAGNLSVSLVRGMGLVAEYSSSTRYFHAGNLRSQTITIYTPHIVADKMACGIFPGSDTAIKSVFDLRFRMKLKCPEPIEQIWQAEHDLGGLTRTAIDALERSLDWPLCSQKLPGFADILGLWSEWILVQRPPFNVLENPLPGAGEPMKLSWKIWREMLDEHPRSHDSPMKNRVLQVYDYWTKSEVVVIPGPTLDSDPNEEIKIQYNKRVFDETIRYFSGEIGRARYVNLVRAHINVNATSLEDAVKLYEQNHPDREPIEIQREKGIHVDMDTERARVYFHNVEKVVQLAQSYDDKTPDRQPNYEDAWWMMMLRLNTWTRNTDLRRPKGTLATCEDYDNPTRVYII